ncbi:DNA cytosine methyltransferase [Streptomyces sp. ITFR-6]|uniref:DNA cytosine methyltransferase n=1 Tax=Streptomyces sp. ITFR-6 TaxID=3075197 RepID=UPI00288962FC|nr:DNA cytosine methyltransferase [Streptomyces sp. ITFR-6]WNI28627.1 DNA cytosine methyltransferase [Streptomyces sp. ITFR-6]
MPILELCAGYGGLGIAVERLIGDKVTIVAEVHGAACKVMSYRFPDAPNIGDIRYQTWTPLVGEVDTITAGFPCQDISNAGKREGIKGDRSSVWFNVAEAIRVLRPRYAFLENVSALRNRGQDEVLASLYEIGYDATWTSLRASEVGAPHHRDRWFCVATPSIPNGL